MGQTTLQERLDLGAHLAKAQTMVLRAYRSSLESMAITTMVNELVATLASSTPQQRFQIVDGTGLCINLLGDRYRQRAADPVTMERVERTERILHSVINSAIERVATYDALIVEYDALVDDTSSIQKAAPHVLTRHTVQRARKGNPCARRC